MKNILLLFVAIFSFNSYGQKINGLGYFKIGKTYKYYHDTLSKIGYDLRDTSISAMLEIALDIVDAEDGTAAYKYNGKEDPRGLVNDIEKFEKKQHKCIVIPKAVVADIVLKGIQLDFWNDTLYSVRCITDYDLFYAITTKYGIKDSTNDTKFEVCEGTFKSKILESTNYLIRDSYKNIMAAFINLARLSKSCEPYHIRLFYVVNLITQERATKHIPRANLNEL